MPEADDFDFEAICLNAKDLEDRSDADQVRKAPATGCSTTTRPMR